MAQENYSSYIPTAGVDWATITNDLINKVNTIGTNRQENKEAIDLLTTKANDLMSKDQLYSSQTFNNLMFSGADAGREQIAKWTAEVKARTLSPQGFKRRVNNLQSKWSTLANSAKTYDNVNQEFMKRQTPNQTTGLSDGTEYEQYLSMIHTELGELGNKKIYFDPNTGEPYIAKFDKEGNIDQTSMTPTFRYAVPNNFYDNTVDFETIIANGTKGLAEYTTEKGRSTITDPLANEATQKAVVNLQNLILNNDRWVNQVLSKYPTEKYDWYRTDEEKDLKISAMIDVEKQTRAMSGKEDYTEDEINKLYSTFEKQMILVSPDGSGVYQPMITKEQRKVAEDIIMNQIKSRIGYQKLEDEPSYSGGYGGGGNKNKEEDNKIDPYLYEIYDAFVTGGPEKLNRLAGGNVFTIFKGKYALIPDDPKDDPSVFFPNVWDTFKQFGYGSKAGEFNKKMKTIYGEKNTGGSLPSGTNEDIPSATNQEWLNTGEWTQDQINKAVKNNQINVI